MQYRQVFIQPTEEFDAFWSSHQFKHSVTPPTGSWHKGSKTTKKQLLTQTWIQKSRMGKKQVLDCRRL